MRQYIETGSIYIVADNIWVYVLELVAIDTAR